MTAKEELRNLLQNGPRKAAANGTATRLAWSKAVLANGGVVVETPEHTETRKDGKTTLHRASLRATHTKASKAAFEKAGAPVKLADWLATGRTEL